MPSGIDFRIDFQDPDEADRWHAINDGVMGGVSQGGMQTAAGTGVFTGRLSLEHGGGFASVRREPGDPALGDARGMRLHVRGDGRTYQLRLRTDRLFEGAAYRARFTTTGEWQSLDLDWGDFEAVFRGRRLEDAPPLAPQDIRQLGFLIADRREGEFRLEIASLEALA
ncbi:CIA30 family protein [Halomonas saccharevitans]|uniref:CIA30 family protein n=1 Tax=Halomonas saccharevitans TaxID=416872 RepID=A0A1I6ZSR6_9GAMM|nr:CIA30 family protein [Halomonas saccharevitans]MDT8878120.1 CIA30 family protein [Halomonas saccharevitans]SFT65720.1 Complex I intermediate-associated protein 30 (CIA30) [Halomonas saccharevitans]